MRYSIFSFIVTLTLSCGDTPDKGNAPETNVYNSNGLFVPADLEVSLWAESPMLFNPTNMDVDAKGRIWITEAVNYRNYNNKDSGMLHRKNGDRVLILEDTNQDGKADVSKVFVQDPDLTSPVGIAVLGSKVVVSCSPNLIVYTDSNGDDVPDNKEIILTGFGGRDHDHSLHAVYAGPDGNWYFNVGNAGPHTVTDKSGFTLRSGSMYTGGSPYNLLNEGNRKSDDGRVWVGGLALKMKPDGTSLQVMGHNFRNAYEVVPDSYGNLWQNDNDDQVVTCRTTWLMEGGNAGYFSTDGTRSWQADQRPGQDIFAAHWHQDDPGVMPAGDCTGAGAPTGVAMIEGNELGERYLGMLLSADAGRNMIFAYRPKLKGSGFDLGTREILISSVPDSNERYVWNDSTHATNKDKWFRPSDVTVGTDGALYVSDWNDPVVGGHQMQDGKGYGRIFRITRKGGSMSSPKFDVNTKAGQIQLLKSSAVNARNDAYTRLKNDGEKNVELLTPLLVDKNPFVRARAAWLISALGEAGRKKTLELLEHEDEQMRAVAYRALRQSEKDIIPYAMKMANDPSPFVRREVAISLRDLPIQQTRAILLKLVEQVDAADRWYVETLGSVLDPHAADMYPEIKKVLHGDDPLSWSKQMAVMAWRLHPVNALKDHSIRASSSSLSASDRQQALTAIAFTNDSAAAAEMLKLARGENGDISAAAKYWLAFRQNNDWASHLDWAKINLNTNYERKLAEMKVRLKMILDEKQSDDERRWQTDAMIKDSLGAQMLLGLAVQDRLPSIIHGFAANKLLAHSHPTIRSLALKYFGDRDTKIAYDVSAIRSMNTDVLNGRKVFETKCANCHSVNHQGGKTGPDLTMIAAKLGEDELLQAIVEPSRSIVFGYESWIITTRDNHSVFGFKISDNAEMLTIRDLSGKDHTFKKKMIASEKKMENSLMPSAAQNELTQQDLANILSYLKQVKQTAAN